MQEVLFFVVSVVLISSSGVLSPGPLFASTVVYGLRENVKAGIKIAHGHAIVELPLVTLLGIGVFSLSDLSQFRGIISIMGAIALFSFAGLQIIGLKQKNSLKIHTKHGPLFSGIIFSAFNPFFLIWWVTIGFKLISDALVNGLLQVFSLCLVYTFGWIIYG